MNFESKAHMARELLAGKRFRNTASGFECFYDESKNCPFRYVTGAVNEPIDAAWGFWSIDGWEEVKQPKEIEYYEWRYKTHTGNWYSSAIWMTEKQAQDFFYDSAKYEKTGKSFKEIEE